MPYRSNGYLEFVRSEECCICSAPAPSDPHHIGPRGMGSKTDDTRTVPLCRRHHDEYHRTSAIAPRTPAQTRADMAEVMVRLMTRYIGQLEARARPIHAIDCDLDEDYTCGANHA
jgi:hypothetical protein